MPRVVVLGSSGFDLTISLDRLPQRGETLLGGDLHMGPGGKGANAAIAARRAGAFVTFLTAFGDDAFGRQVREHDIDEGLDLEYARAIAGVPNQVALIFVGGDGGNLIGVAPGASARLTPEDIDNLPDEVFDPGAVLLASLEVPLETVTRALERAGMAGMTTVLNPAPADPRLIAAGSLKDVTVLTPNQEEARVLTGKPTDTPRLAAQAATELAHAGPKHVIVTLGDEGCLIVSGTSDERVEAFRVPVVDTVGAGDAFNGALAVALAEGRPILEAARWASAAGALAVTRRGAQGALPRRADIDLLFNSQRC
jgi:ribokinase